MKKIPTIFARNPVNLSEVTDERNPVCDWVFAGEGIATRKWDGTAVLISDIGVMFKRYDCKKGRTPPLGFIEADSADPITGHWPGWVPIKNDDPADKWFVAAYLESAVSGTLPHGTYEAIGPHFQGNPDGASSDCLIRHGSVPVDFRQEPTREALKSFFVFNKFEGIVWHHPDGRMAKIKARDFGIRRR